MEVAETADGSPAPEWAVAAWVGGYTAQGPEARPPTLLGGGAARLRPSAEWAGELLLGGEGRGVDPRLAAVRFLGDPYAPIVPFLTVAAGARFGGTPRGIGEGGFGLDIALGEWFDLRADARLRYTSDGEGGVLLALGPQLHRPHAYDADQDGVDDHHDGCRTTPEDPDGYEDDDGCPDPDNDGDGVRDPEDACPGAAEDRDRFLDGDGCPDPDNDGDGILDTVDLCALEPEDHDGHEDRDGCLDPDDDADHVYDDVDACPNVPEDEDGFEDADGCPDPDNDGDGVGDRFDGAPNAAETLNGWADADGVPDEVPPILARFLGDQPRIAFTGDAMTEAGQERLDLLAAVLGTFPDVRLRMTLPDVSADRGALRAEAVQARLHAAGVDPARVSVEVVEGAGPVVVALAR